MLRQQAEQEKRASEAAEKQARTLHQKKLEELRQQHASEKGTAEAAWAVAKAETQQQWLTALQNLQQKGADQLAAQLATSTQVGPVLIVWTGEDAVVTMEEIHVAHLEGACGPQASCLGIHLGMEEFLSQ